MRRSVIPLLILMAAGSAGLAQDWAEAVFDHTTHDFGTVARNQKVEHRFPIENIYVEDLCIESVSSSCRCFQIEIPKSRLKTYEKGAIVVKVDTKKSLSRRQATVKVKLNFVTDTGVLSGEVQLHTYVYIRSDVVLEPGTVDFGSLPHGAGAAPQKISISYAGRDDWKIVEAECANPHVELKLVETGRNLGKVSYDLFVGLKPEAPVGYVRDPVILTTNDQNKNATHVVVNLEGEVAAALSAKPSPLMLGLLKPGQEVKRTLVVRGEEPFRIVEMSGSDGRFQFDVADQARKLHVVPVTYSAGDTPGKIDDKIRIVTDLSGNEVLEVPCSGRVVEP